MMKDLIAPVAGVLLAGMIAAAPASAGELQEIKESGELRIAMSGAYPPFSLINNENKVVGFDVEIGSEIARRLGVEPVIVTTAWDGIIAGLLAGKYDTIVGSMSITPTRDEVVDFVGPYYHAGRALFVSENAEFSSLEDLKGKTIGVTLGETHEKWAREQTEMNWTLKTYKGLPELLLELENGRVDAIVIDSIPGNVAIQKSGKPIKKLEVSGIEGSDVAVGIAIPQDSPELKSAMQHALDEMMADGTYKEIAMEWVGADIR